MAKNERGAGRKSLPITKTHIKVTVPNELLPLWERVENKAKFTREAISMQLIKEKKALKAAFENFMHSEFEDACIKSTRAGWAGGGYSVELFPDGIWRVLWDNQIGNLYDSRGIIVSVPSIGDDDWDEDNGHFFGNAEDAMRGSFEDAIEHAS